MASEYFSVPGIASEKRECSVDVYIECVNLRDEDILSKSDPCAVLFMSRKGGHLMEIGRTETVKNTIDPKFARPIRVDYHFEEEQRIQIKIYDVDKTSGMITDKDLLGTLHCTLGQVVKNSHFKRPLQEKKERKGKAHITVRAYRPNDDSDTVELTFQARKLAKMDVLSKSDPFLEIQKETRDGHWLLTHRTEDVLSKSDPFLEIQKETRDGHWLLTHRTEVIKNNLDPTWRNFTISTQKLCDDDKHKRIKIDCYDHDDDGKHGFIGGFTTTLEEIMKPLKLKEGFACIDPKKAQKKQNYTNSGVVFIRYQVQQSVKERTFLDFVLGGMNMNFTVGIDFTHSNGDPSLTESLHHISPCAPNEYMMAIKAVGNICQCYDSDNLFPAFGFGAKIPPSNVVSHDFPINFNYGNPNCSGIDGVLDAYKMCLQQVELLGPTIVAPVINRVVKLALAAQKLEPANGPHAYHVLLLLTDGIFNDMVDTKRAIIEASSLPMSLIIVGVGFSDFSEMKELSGEGGVLTLPSGEKAKRDIVQFVCFKDFKQHSIDELASKVLAKIPRQVTDYFKMRGLKPGNQRRLTSSTTG